MSATWVSQLVLGLTPTGQGPRPRDASLARLGALCGVPVALGAYAPAVQLAGELSDKQAIMLQCGTYAVALVALGGVHLASQRARARIPRSTWRSGIELGLWLSLAGALELLGLQRTDAARAGFLVRLSTAIVPLAEAVCERRAPTPRTCAAVSISSVGAALVILTPGVGAAFSSTIAGDCLVACAALLYSGHIVRLSSLAPNHDPLPLAITKAATGMLFAQLTLAVGYLWRGSATMHLRTIPRLWRTALFTGLVTCAFPAWAQSFGQQRVRASQASLVVATAPVWNAVFAAWLLGQQLTRRALLGASLMICGQLLSIFAHDPKPATEVP